VYLLIGSALVATVWAAMTWPWSLMKRPT